MKTTGMTLAAVMGFAGCLACSPLMALAGFVLFAGFGAVSEG